jgi:hypothetical protein
MSVELREVTIPSITRRAEQFHQLANNTSLRTVNPETAERYKTWPNAIKNTTRLALREGFHAYVVLGYENLSPIGIATVIRNQLLQKIGEDHLTSVHDLDYSLLADARDEDHADVANELVAKSRTLAWRYNRAPIALGPDSWSVTEEDAHHNYAATIDSTNPDANRGFTQVESLYPAVAHYVDYGQDIDYMTKGGHEVQFYVGHEILTHKP